MIRNQEVGGSTPPRSIYFLSMPKKAPAKILVIDDDPSTVRLLEKWLAVAGYDVLSAFNGTSGVVKAKEGKPDLILLDVMIPDLSGAEVTKKLKEDDATRQIPIVFITVTISKRNDKISKHIEIDGQLYQAFAKPLYQPKLLSVIRKLIRRPS